jgi:leucyl aminopeptidase
MSLTVSTADSVPEDVEVLGVGAHPEQLDAIQGVDAGHLARRGFTGKPGQTCAVPDGAAAGRTVLVVGLGPPDEVEGPTLRRAAAQVARQSRRAASVATTLAEVRAEGLDLGVASQAVAEGLVLGAHRDDRWKGEPEPNELVEATVVGGDGPAVEQGRIVAQAQVIARDLVNEPGGSLLPAELADRATEIGEAAGLEVEILGEDAIREQALGGLLGVNRGSEHPPRLIILRHRPDSPRGHVALVGKGITFDAGGLSIKTGDGMKTMKDDMAGGAAVIAAMGAAPAVAPDVAVTAFVPATDNMLGGDATRPGDILTMADGSTVEVLNTDAEGRLVLADALHLAAAEEPDAVIDVATLTGACMVALGPKIAGLMGNDDEWVDAVRAAADRAGERVWPLPLPDDYRKQLDSALADRQNIGGRLGGALTAGLFLSAYVPDDLPWAHVDIAGPAFADEIDGENPKGGTGFGVRTLLEVLAGHQRG